MARSLGFDRRAGSLDRRTNVVERTPAKHHCHHAADPTAEAAHRRLHARRHHRRGRPPMVRREERLEDEQGPALRKLHGMDRETARASRSNLRPLRSAGLGEGRPEGNWVRRRDPAQDVSVVPLADARRDPSRARPRRRRSLDGRPEDRASGLARAARIARYNIASDLLPRRFVRDVSAGGPRRRVLRLFEPSASATPINPKGRALPSTSSIYRSENRSQASAK